MRIHTYNAVSPPVVHADAKAIEAGYRHSMVLKRDGTVWATGWNNWGQLGDGTRISKTTFVKVVSSGQCGTTVWTARHHRHCIQ